MTGERPRDLLWTRERWFMTVTIVFAVQVVTVIWLSAREEIVPASDTTRFATFQMTEDFSREQEELLNLLNPSLYAYADAHGFSGRAWLKVAPIEYRSRGWSDEPQFLKFDEEKLLSDLERYGQTGIPDRLPIKIESTWSQRERVPLTDILKPSPTSVLAVSGEFNFNDLRRYPGLPVVSHDGVLQPSVVIARVDRRGRVFSVQLTQKSGSAVADQDALRIARQLEFSPDPTFSANLDPADFAQLRNARLAFRWWTTPVIKPAPTNQTENVEAKTAEGIPVQ